MKNNSQKTSVDTRKRATNNKRLPTAKQTRFAQEYVKDLNGANAAEVAYNVNNRHTARSVAAENLAKPVVRAEIERLLAENGVQTNEIINIHAQNMRQRKHLPTSQKAVESFERMLGIDGGNDDSGNTVNIAVVVE